MEQTHQSLPLTPWSCLMLDSTAVKSLFLPVFYHRPPQLSVVIITSDFPVSLDLFSIVMILIQNLFKKHYLVPVLCKYTLYIDIPVQLSTFNFGSMEYLTVLSIHCLIQTKRQTISPPDLYRVWRASVGVASVPHLSQIHY